MTQTIINNQTNTVRSSTRTQQKSAQRTTTYQTIGGSNITYIRGGNVMEDDAQTLLVGCNTQGEMKLGVAGQVARKYQEVVGAYKAACQSDDAFLPGSARRARTRSGAQLILMGIWKLQEFAPKAEWINSALRKFYDATMSGQVEVTSIATVKLGCFKGQTSLDWEVIGPVMADYLDTLGVPVRIYVGPEDAAFFGACNEDGKHIVTRVEPSATPAYDESDNL